MRSQTGDEREPCAWMSDPKLQYPVGAHTIPTWIRLENIRACLERGMIDLASDLFKLIDPARASEPQVLALGQKLEKARRELAREN